MIKVNVSIVGFYFGLEVEVPDGASIQDAMVAAMNNSRGQDPSFTFTATSYGTLSNVTVVHTSRAQSRNSDKTYDPGVYSYTDDPDVGNPSLVWQYYIFSSEDERREKRGTEIPFAKNPLKLQDGDQIIWRLVGICTGPTTAMSTKEMLAQRALTS